MELEATYRIYGYSFNVTHNDVICSAVRANSAERSSTADVGKYNNGNTFVRPSENIRDSVAAAQGHNEDGDGDGDGDGGGGGDGDGGGGGDGDGDGKGRRDSVIVHKKSTLISLKDFNRFNILEF